PDMRRLYWAGRQSAFAYSRALETKQPAEAIAAAKKKRDEAYDDLYRFALEFRGPVNYLNPEIDPKTVQHLWYEYIEVEGPIAEWPTKASKEILFKGAESGDADYVRQIFARFLPRVYRRPVKAEEVEAQVRRVQTMQEKHGKSFPDAV